ncbi:MAG: hypothetical protein R3F08_06660 [Dokdonella sp.]
MHVCCLSALSLPVMFAAAHSAHAEDASSHQWQRPDGAAGATLSVSGPRGSRHFTFAANQSVVVNPSMLGGDGLYTGN